MTESTPTTTHLLTRLSNAVGVTGYTGPNSAAEVISAAMQPFVDRLERDRLGSVVGIKEGAQLPAAGEPRRKIMLAAHLDEIGAVVTQLDRGVLRFSKVGGLDARVLMGQEVTVHGKRDLPGIIGSIPPHLLPADEPGDTVDPTKLHVDVGLPAADLKKLVQVGDLISFARTPAELLNGLVSAKAMDNRASVAAVLVCLQELANLRHSWDVYAVATADEEWGRYVGATTQTYAIRPDAAIAIDVTFADVDEIDVSLDAGPVITLGPGNHPGLRKRLLQSCQALEMKYQNEVQPRSAGTDAAAIEVSRAGVPTVLISIPSRNMHSPVEIVHPKDVERAGRLMAHFIAGLDNSFVDSLTPEL
jgi:endoglucanase